MTNADVFVLVLALDQYQKTNLLEQTVAGRKICDWVTAAVQPLPHEVVTTSIKDDIITIFKNHLPSAQYTVIIYNDMPLLTTHAINQAVDFCARKNLNAVKLPRGWVFNTQYIAQNAKFSIEEFKAADPTDYLVAFNHQQIAKIRAVMQERINDQHLRHGVDIIDPQHTYIDASVKIAAGCTIQPNVHLQGNTQIAEQTTLLDGTNIADATVGSHCQIGPYAHIRPFSSIGNRCRIGNFVEIKRSKIGDGTKIAHMTYVGDSTLGQNDNIGCGVIFCNYNGKTKNNCIVGDDVFVGSNSCLVAPLEIGNHAYIAAGSVITDQVPANALGISRARQAIKENYVTDDTPN